MLIRIMVMALVLAFVGSVAAQGKDGKVIRLPVKTEVDSPPAPKDTSIVAPSLTASLRYGISEIVPVAGEEFLLLDKDLGAILRGAGLHGDSGLDEVHTYAVNRVYPEPAQAEFMRAAQAAIEPHVVARVKTNQAGQGQFPATPAGTYTLLGVVKTRSGLAIWIEFVKLKTGVTTITLDHNNVELAN